MSIVDQIFQIYPELTKEDFVEFVLVQDDSNGKGPYIAKWEHPSLAKPTADQLARTV
jgi:hypothetical protein